MLLLSGCAKQEPAADDSACACVSVVCVCCVCCACHRGKGLTSTPHRQTAGHFHFLSWILREQRRPPPSPPSLAFVEIPRPPPPLPLPLPRPPYISASARVRRPRHPSIHPSSRRVYRPSICLFSLPRRRDGFVLFGESKENSEVEVTPPPTAHTRTHPTSFLRNKEMPHMQNLRPLQKPLFIYLFIYL